MIRQLQQLWPLARRYPFCGVCAGLSVLLLLGSIATTVWMRSLTKSHRARQAESRAVQATLVSAPQLQQELAFVRQITQRINSTLVSDDNLADNSLYFYNMEEVSHARVEALRNYNVGAPDTGVPYKRVPFGLTVSGTFTQVATFIHAIETGPRLSAITYFSLRRRAGTPLIVAEISVDLLGKR